MLLKILNQQALNILLPRVSSRIFNKFSCTKYSNSKKVKYTINMNNNDKKRYSLLLLTNIPVNKLGGTYKALDLWVKDITSNAKFVTDICLLCPSSKVNIKNSIKFSVKNIKIIFLEEVNSKKEFSTIISKYDVIQVNAGSTVRNNKILFQVIKIAKKLNKKIIVSVSSDREKTTLLNASTKSRFKRIKAYIISRLILLSAKKMILLSDGLMLIGQGLVPKYSFGHSHIHVGIASWINMENIISNTDFQKKIEKIKKQDELHLCIATRLEAMKGVHLGIEALCKLNKSTKINLDIYGEGDELPSLKKLVKKMDVEGKVKFLGYISYGKLFYSAIREYDLMLLTNLNIEQPRLIFDAISQGMLPICPKSSPYLAFGFDEAIMYKMGDSNSLANTINKFQNKDFLIKILKSLYNRAEDYTIDSMHRKRAIWMSKLLKGELDES